MGKNRGDTLTLESGLRVFATVHPSSLLRVPDEADKQAAPQAAAMNFQFRLRGLAPPPGVFAIEFVPFMLATLSVVFAVDPFADDFISASDDMVDSPGRVVELPMQGRSLLAHSFRTGTD